MAISHDRTFEWLFDPTKTKFSSWLEDTGDDDPIFWIKGKPGAGQFLFRRGPQVHVEKEKSHAIFYPNREGMTDLS